MFLFRVQPQVVKSANYCKFQSAYWTTGLNINKDIKKYIMQIDTKKTKITVFHVKGSTKLGSVLMVNKYRRLTNSNT